MDKESALKRSAQDLTMKKRTVIEEHHGYSLNCTPIEHEILPPCSSHALIWTPPTTLQAEQKENVLRRAAYETSIRPLPTAPFHADIVEVRSLVSGKVE
jgi:hypothetical protein